ncbi:MAG: ornithine carbamoyltransferase [Candidatus Diapherotrites archaeon]|nr:ornithine carbamoyltransferase [Candidatus Diapherotrites archaeon]
MKSILSLFDLDKTEILHLVELAGDIKKNPQVYSGALTGKTLMMLFEKPSLRTKISFDVGMQSMGGNTLVIDSQSSPFKSKETVADTAKVSSRYVDIIMARLFEHNDLVEMAQNASVPVINGLTNDFHPVQILSDLLTIKEKKGRFDKLKLCFLGDGFNNVTHSLIIGCAHMGIDVSVGCPSELSPKQEIVDKANAIAQVSEAKITVTQDAKEAIKDADIVYADSWMSYHIPESEKEKRVQKFLGFQVNSEIVKGAKPDFIFMNCLPAMRGFEQTAEIIDGRHSVVFDQAENRLHMQKAIMLECLK